MKEWLRWQLKRDWVQIGAMPTFDGVRLNFLSPYYVDAWKCQRTGEIREVLSGRVIRRFVPKESKRCG